MQAKEMYDKLTDVQSSMGSIIERMRALRKVDPDQAKKLQKRLRRRRSKRTGGISEADLKNSLREAVAPIHADAEETAASKGYYDDEESRESGPMREVLEKFRELEAQRGAGREDTWEGEDADDFVTLMGAGQKKMVDDFAADDEDAAVAKKDGISKKKLKKLMRPNYIEATRIAEIRSAIEEKDAQKTLRQKMRERVRPRHKKMAIDYQVLHDAFFKYKTKPSYTRFGEMYFEGKEAEMQMRKYVPGKLSDRAREALGMTAPLDPPPWLLNMQRYGPPPSFPGLVVPGVNAHIPEGAVLGFQSGGWGRIPTLDQLQDWGVPPRFDEAVAGEGVHVGGQGEESFWGQLQTIESSDDEGSAPEMEDTATIPGTETPGGLTLGGMATPVALDPSGMSSVISAQMVLGQQDGMRSAVSSFVSGLDTPGSVDIKGGFLSGATPQPYTILERQKAPVQPGAIFASDAIYQMPTGSQGTKPGSQATESAHNLTP